MRRLFSVPDNIADEEGLRAELGSGPVTVTTAVPGLMRTGSHVRALFSGQQDKEFTWFALGASLPVVSMDAGRAARRIVSAMRRRRGEVILTPGRAGRRPGCGRVPRADRSPAARDVGGAARHGQAE